MFRPLDFSKLERPPATVATPATNETDRVRVGRNVATVATVASLDADTAYYAAELIDPAAIEERAGLADSVPAVYRDAWARLNHQKPANVNESRWRIALDDGGRFLDAWGDEAAELGWTAGDLFESLFGLVWRLVGQRVELLGPGDAELSDGRVIRRGWV
jgi:hypothetical protein